MLKDVSNLREPDPYYSGAAGFVGSTLEQLHEDVSALELPHYVPEGVRRYHDGLRNACVYSYFSYDLLTLAASQTFPCLELALRLRIGDQFEGRLDRKGKSRPPAMLAELLEAAKAQKLIWRYRLDQSAAEDVCSRKRCCPECSDVSYSISDDNGHDR